MFYSRNSAPRESASYELQIQEAAPSIWDLLAQRAGLLDAECRWSDISVSTRKQQSGSAWLWPAMTILERFVAAALLLFCAPIFFFAALVVVILSRRSPLIAHRRVGWNGSELWVVKLRTMWNSKNKGENVCHWVERLADQSTPNEVKHCKDPRITSRVALFCRKYSIDEIPQLWQVVRGEMALVGPRPLTAGEIHRHYGPFGPLLCHVKPGLTGLWQVKGRSRLNYHQRRRLDLFMIQRWSLPLYLFILIATGPRVLLGKDAW